MALFRFFSNSLILSFLCLASSIFVCAQEPTALVVWVGNSGELGKLSYEAAIEEVQQASEKLQIRRVVAGKDAIEGRIEDIGSIFENKDEKISVIMIGTHGNTSKKGKETRLESLGGFRQEGAYGPLKTLISNLGEQGRLSPNLHFYLNSCSTFCGDREKVKERVHGLFREVSLYGVESISVWGATQSMIRSDLRENPKLLRTLARTTYDRRVYMAYGGMGMALVSLAAFARVWADSFSEQSVAHAWWLEQSFLVATITPFLFGYITDLYSWLRMKSWTNYSRKGLLAKIDHQNKKVSLEEVEWGIGSRHVMGEMQSNNLCESVLSK